MQTNTCLSLNWKSYHGIQCHYKIKNITHEDNFTQKWWCTLGLSIHVNKFWCQQNIQFLFRKRLGNAFSDIKLWIICVISPIDGETSGAGDVMTRKLKSTWGAAGFSFLSFSKALCVCQSRSMFCESYLMLFVKLQVQQHIKLRYV